MGVIEVLIMSYSSFSSSSSTFFYTTRVEHE